MAQILSFQDVLLVGISFRISKHLRRVLYGQINLVNGCIVRFGVVSNCHSTSCNHDCAGIYMILIRGFAVGFHVARIQRISYKTCPFQP